MQKIIILSTSSQSLRSEVWGWDGEDSALYDPLKHIGFTPSFRVPAYKTVLEAMNDGWKLMGPPVDDSTKETFRDPINRIVSTSKIYQYSWWLTKG